MLFFALAVRMGVLVLLLVFFRHDPSMVSQRPAGSLPLYPEGYRARHER